MLLAALLLQTSDWHLPPLVPGRETTVTIAPSDRFADLRYHSLFATRARFEAKVGDAPGLYLELYDELGRCLSYVDEHEPGQPLACEFEIAALEKLHVRVGRATAPEAAATAVVRVTETPARDPAWDAAIQDAGPALDLKRQHVLEEVGPLCDQADAAIDAGDDAMAEPLIARSIELFLSAWPADLPDLVQLRGTLADTRFHRNVATRDELERALDGVERCPQIQEVDRLRLLVDLENWMARHGDLDEARALLESILPALGRAFPPTDGEPLCARLDYSLVLLSAGELVRARAIAESALDDVLRSRKPGDDLRLQARGTLVAILFQAGDAPAAHEQERQNVDEVESVLPAGHRDVWMERLQLARLEGALGNHEEAEAIQSEAVEALGSRLPETADLLLVAECELAKSRRELGRIGEARELFERAVALAREHRIHDEMAFAAQAGLAATIGDLGDRHEERDREQSLLAELGRLPEGEPARVAMLSRLARTLAALGDEDELAACEMRLARELDAALALHPPYSWRELGETARQFEEPLSTLLSFVPQGHEALGAWCFHWIETLRARTAGVGLVPSGTTDPELEMGRARVAASRRAVDAVVARLRERGEATDGLREELANAVRARDSAEQQLAMSLASRGRASVTIDASDLTKALPPNSAAVGFRVWDRVTLDERGAAAHEPWLLAHVVVPGAPLRRLDLAPVAAVTDLVQHWRAEPDDGLGKQLEQLLLAPVLAAAPDTTSLDVCLDGPLFLLPLDALPLPDGALVGEKLRIHVLSSFAPLLLPQISCATPPSLLTCGGIDYGASAGAPAAFAPLPATKFESESIAALFPATSGRPATSLVGAQATEAALRRLAPQHRFVHLATHGWLVPDPAPAAGARSGRDRRVPVLPKDPFAPVRALAPMTLCGLALAGANRGVDERGLPIGRMTAEEVAGLDLSGCELVVLSACDTGLGVDTKRAGQAIQSLQAALHAAGARSSITSLWKVDDVATLDLMKEFYGALWREKRPKSEALWNAKMALRKSGEPTRRWAGWVLTGLDE